MNKDSEAQIEALFTWLLQPSGADNSDPSTSLSPEENRPDPSLSRWLDQEDESSFDGETVDPLDSEDLDRIYSPQSHPFEIGEIPAVQDRFQALLKQRIQAQLQSHLPVFPWESQVMDYEDDPCESGVSAPITAQVWMMQLKQLRLSVSVELPESLLEQLFAQCQQVARSTLKEGAKLVQAVESLFPGDFLALNQMASRLLLGAYRDEPLSVIHEPVHPVAYEQITRHQQMRLCLLVTQKILQMLTLKPVLNGEAIACQWETAGGQLGLTAQYRQIEGRSLLRVEAFLPGGGRIQLQSGQAQAIASRPDSGYLSVELPELTGDRPHSLIVELDSHPEAPLRFAIDPQIVHS